MFRLGEGCEVRGFMIRLYPTPEQVETLGLLEDDLRSCWNWLCKQTEEVLDATRVHAVRVGLVPDPGCRNRHGLPCFPQCDFDGMTPDESEAAKERRSGLIKAWHEALYAATKDTIQWRPPVWEQAKLYGHKYDYQLFASDSYRHHETVKPCAHMYQALVKNFYAKSTGAKRKKPRKRWEAMPLQVRSGTCLEIGGVVPACSGAVEIRPQPFGTRRGKPFYDALVKINGLKILGRLPGRLPAGRVLDGIAVTRQADGWWASVKVEVAVRALPSPNPGKVVGIDVGLKYAIAAFDDGTLVRNAREASFTNMIAGLQSEKDRADDETAKALENKIARLHQKQRKHMRHVIYTEILPKCSDAEIIRVEKLQSKIGQMGTRHMSVMRTIRAMLVERYGDRVQEVDPRYTSQVCSECGHLDKEAWGHDGGPIRHCPECGFRCHRDVNAARNIASGGVVEKVQGVLAARKTKRIGANVAVEGKAA